MSQAKFDSTPYEAIAQSEVLLLHKRAKDLRGLRFGRLVVIEYAGRNKHEHLIWSCRCDCGKVIITEGPSLVSSNTKSCGCLQKETVRKIATKHNMHKTPEYSAWRDMKNHCYNTKNSRYKIYGARGITICEEWIDDFMAFYDHIGPRPSDNLSLDRIDVNGNYEPGNVRWATRSEQQENRRDTRFIMYDGLFYTVRGLSEHLGLTPDVIKTRFKNQIQHLNAPRVKKE